MYFQSDGLKGAYDSQNILEECFSFMSSTDITECIANVYYDSMDSVQYQRIVELLKSSHVRQQELSETCAILYIRHPTLVPTLGTCEYWRYSLPMRPQLQQELLDKVSSDPGNYQMQLFTRERPRDSGLCVRSLLSNKLHGVDNTGNICVWPAEPLLLHTLLTVPRYTALVANKRVLELGGGMTALAGLGLAAAGIGLCTLVVVTDGHPDCVANQVRGK